MKFLSLQRFSECRVAALKVSFRFTRLFISYLKTRSFLKCGIESEIVDEKCLFLQNVISVFLLQNSLFISMCFFVINCAIHLAISELNVFL